MTRRKRVRRVTQPMSASKLRDPSIELLGFKCFRLFRVPRGFEVMAWFDHTHMMATLARQ
jgi:hypothetical protein